MARRVDWSDGGAYTRQEFISHYGGTDEWENSEPAGGGKGGRGGSSADIEKVKELQRTSAAFRAAWTDWCDTYMDGSKDPNKMNPRDLGRGLRQCAGRVAAGGGSAGGGRTGGRTGGGGYGSGPPRRPASSGGKGAGRGGKGRGGGKGGAKGGKRGGTTARGGATLQAALAERVRRLQQSDEEFREKWAAYCEANPDPGGPKPYGTSQSASKDPQRHSTQYLRSALQECDSGYNPDAAAVLAETVMRKQREGGDFAEQWITWCTDESDGTFDPRRMDDDTIRRALEELDPDALKETQSAINIVGKVREKQRTSEAFLEEWRSWCQDNNEGTMDPAKLPPDVLRRVWGQLKSY